MDKEASGGSAISRRIRNIYYMLAYAFRALKAGDVTEMGGEQFQNVHELFAEIIIRGMRRQLKRGLPHTYVEETEELRYPRGRIDLQASVRKVTMTMHRLVCNFDEFTEDTPGNRLIKCAMTHLMKQDEVSHSRKRDVRFLWSNLHRVSDVGYIGIPKQRTGDAEYVTLVNICRFLLDGLLMNTGSGYEMLKWLTDDRMSWLYEQFVLEYFKRHHPDLGARSARIDWDMPVVPEHMPAMESDVYLSYGGRTLIIDAKYYSRTMSQHYGKATYHSQNLYQIYAYVKNADRARDGSVSGMLLYAKTDEDIVPDADFVIGGNAFSVKTLDLAQDFRVIRSQLDRIAFTLRQGAVEVP
mgnify:CR=1 FL=1|jgi:5-methylcytosine-specific restriction enzyme subunit McrC